MKTRYGSRVLPFLALALFALAACTQPDVAPPAAAPTDPPPAASAAPLPASAQAAIGDFANQQQAIDQEWEQIREEFDQWRAGLISCHPNAMREALNDFAVAFNDVTEQARGLTRGQSSSELADLLITAAEEEEAALRQLRDRWQPNNVSLFEQVEQRRSQASHAQKNAEDRAIELRATFASGVDSKTTEEFAQSFDRIKSDWQQFHEEYAAWRKEADSLEADAVFTGLEQIVENLTPIADALDELPALDGAESTIERLQSAVQAEMEAFQATKKTSSTSSKETASEETSAEETSAEEAADTQELPDYDAIDAGIKESEDALEEASDAIGKIAAADPVTEVDPAVGLAELQVFNGEYNSLLLAWADFNDRYNDWRRSEGGCDRTEVVAALEQFSLRTGKLGRDVRDLPRSGYLLPISALLVEAVAGEENAVRTLRHSWQPFTTDAFKAVDQERVNADGLRRGAELALQELRSRP